MELRQWAPDLVRYTAERVGRVHIATNGSFLPDDPNDAKAFLSDFPPNITFILSADRYHAEALQKRGRSLPHIFQTLYDVTAMLGMGLEIFLRYPVWHSLTLKNKKYWQEISGGLDRHLFGRLLHERRVHSNSVHRQNGAGKLPAEDTTHVSVLDFIQHSHRIDSLGIFITQQGLVTGNPHSAYMKNLPPFSVLGDLHDKTLADIFR